jgi:hypothetical protein
VVKDFSPEVRRGIRHETTTDLIDCLLGVIFCTSAILAVISPLGRHWTTFIVVLVIGIASGGLFITRWSRRGVFRSLSADATEQPEVETLAQ